MSLGNGILVLIAIWCTIHLLSCITTHKSSSIFPTNNSRHSPRHTRVLLHSLHLKISTSAWNSYHDKLSSFLARRGRHRINSLFKLTYDVGTIFGAVGVVVAVVALLWICTSSAWMLLQKMSLERGTRTSDASHLVKRAMSDLETSMTPHVSSPYFGITPIVSPASSRHPIVPIIYRYLGWQSH